MMHWQIEPMPRWPYPESETRKPSPFQASWNATLQLLETELDHLDVIGAVAVRVVTSDADVRRDGMLRAHAVVHHPGVAISFHSNKVGDLAYPCDRFFGTYRGRPHWQVNLRAIALGLESLRRLDRYGIAGRGEQYTGWRAIEAPGQPGFASADEAIAWLHELVDPNGGHRPTPVLLRLAALEAHPDRNGGDRTLWDRVDAARQLLEREGRAS